MRQEGGQDVQVRLRQVQQSASAACRDRHATQEHAQCTCAGSNCSPRLRCLTSGASLFLQLNGGSTEHAATVEPVFVQRLHCVMQRGYIYFQEGYCLRMYLRVCSCMAVASSTCAMS